MTSSVRTWMPHSTRFSNSSGRRTFGMETPHSTRLASSARLVRTSNCWFALTTS